MTSAPDGYPPAAVKLLYKPLGIVLGIVAGMLSTKAFAFLWGRIDDQEPPGPTTRDSPLGKVLMAAALQGMVFRVVRTLVDRQGARGFEYLTGFWPGEKRPDPKP